MKKYAVIGLGSFGFNVAKAMYEEDVRVMAIDIDRALIQSIAHHSSEAITLDATDRDGLKTLGLENMDGVVVATGTNPSVSILICLYLHEIGVKKILAKALDDDHAKILMKVGATEVIHPERDMAKRVARSLARPNMLDFIPIADGFELVQVGPPAEFVGKSLATMNLRARYGVFVIAIRQLVPEQFILVPQADFVVKDSDVLVMLGKSEDINRIKSLK